MQTKLTHNLLVPSPASGGLRGTRRPAMTFAELLVVLIISSIVITAAFTMVSAFISNSMSSDLKNIRAEGSLLYTYVHGWFQEAELIATAYGPDYDTDPPTPPPNNPPEMGDIEVGIALVAAYMGPREHGGVIDDKWQYDEVEAMVFTMGALYTADGVIGPDGEAGGGVLERLYYADPNATIYDPEAEGALCVPDDWLANADREFLSNNVLRMSWQPPLAANCAPEGWRYLDLRFTLMDFDQVGPDMPLQYFIQIVASARGL